jgi:hypothetical protein
MAEAMQQQAVLPIEMPTVPGAKVSHLQGLAKLFQGYIAGKNLSKADQEQKDYENSVSEDTARLFRNMGKTETVPGEVITPGQESMFIPENVTRYNETKNQPESFTPEERNAAIDLPLKTQPVAPTYGPDRQVPLLSADLLNPTNPLAMKTGQGKQMLAQYLMQQEAQKQAAAQRAQEAALQIHTAKPGETAYRMGANNVPVPFLNTPAQPKWEHTSKFENGQEVTGWVNTNAADIPGSFVQGTVKPEMTASQQLDAEAKIYAAQVEAAKSQDVGRKPVEFQRMPKGVPVGAKRIGKTPDGKDVYELNNKKYVGE